LPYAEAQYRLSLPYAEAQYRLSLPYAEAQYRLSLRMQKPNTDFCCEKYERDLYIECVFVAVKSC